MSVEHVEPETCDGWIEDFWAVPGIRTACGRAADHPGEHWPERLVGDPR